MLAENRLILSQFPWIIDKGKWCNNGKKWWRINECGAATHHTHLLSASIKWKS